MLLTALERETFNGSKLVDYGELIERLELIYKEATISLEDTANNNKPDLQQPTPEEPT